MTEIYCAMPCAFALEGICQLEKINIIFIYPKAICKNFKLTDFSFRKEW